MIKIRNKVPCKCGLTLVPNWIGYTSGREDCSVLCTNTGKYNKRLVESDCLVHHVPTDKVVSE